MLDTTDFEKVKLYISDYSLKKNELNDLAIELDKIHKEENSRSGDLKYLYSLEDKHFRAVIDCLCIYEDLWKFFDRVEENENNQFVVRQLKQKIERLDPIYMDVEYYVSPEEIND